MSSTIDARGLSCPQPVLMTLKEIQALGRGEITALVDTATSKENVIRALAAKGLEVKVREEEDSYRITVFKP